MVVLVYENRIGMEQQYADQVFQPFKRRHTWEESQGTGIGLAVCKRLVANHGGKIWGASFPGPASTFFFAIQKLVSE